MRRLLLVAALLVLPSVAKADELPPNLAFIGCTNPLAGCIQGIMTPSYNATVDAILYHWIITDCERCAANDIDFNRLTLYGAGGTGVYSYRSGNLLGGDQLRDTPVFGIFESASPGHPTAAVVVTTTPEPVTTALLGTGLALLGAARRRRRLALSEA